MKNDGKDVCFLFLLYFYTIFLQNIIRKSFNFIESENLCWKIVKALFTKQLHFITS